MNTVALTNLSLEEKLATMEQIWDDLCQNQNATIARLASGCIAKPGKNRQAGQEQPMDWQDAKKLNHQRTH
jgi:hypothetical protein